MIDRTLLPLAADPRRPMPEHSGTRLDAIETALRVLGEEDRRFERLGFDGGRERCREARRFWGFVGAMVTLADHEAAGSRNRGAGK